MEKEAMNEFITVITLEVEELVVRTGREVEVLIRL